MKPSVLITGASGLLGRALVKEFVDHEFFVWAHYFSRVPKELESNQCKWIPGDFSSLDGIRNFISRWGTGIEGCDCLVNNFGPINYKPFARLTAEDFYPDFHQNVIPAFEITRFLLDKIPSGSSPGGEERKNRLEAVANIGFEFLGQVRPYRNIVTYAAAKNALQLLTLAFEQQYPHVRFRIFSPPNLEGGDIQRKNGTTISPVDMAREIYSAFY